MNDNKISWIIKGFRLACDNCKSNKFFVFTQKESITNTYICSECGNIIYQDDLNEVF